MDLTITPITRISFCMCHRNYADALGMVAKYDLEWELHDATTLMIAINMNEAFGVLSNGGDGDINRNKEIACSD